MIRLSITIPTYDRLPRLVETLKALLSSSLPPEVEVIILDNHSPVELEPQIRALPGGDSTSVKIVRHSANIGLAANILRCFEYASGDWVWTLGDDDIPYPHAIQTILRELGKTEDRDILLKFNSANGGMVTEGKRIYTLEELSMRCSYIDFYSNFLFISSSVFRRKFVLERLGVGYHWGYSLSPHVAIVLHAMTSGLTVRLIPRELVQHGRVLPEQLWSVTRLRAAFNSLGDIEGADVFASVALPRLALAYLRPRMLRTLVLCFIAENERSPRFWRTFYARHAAVIGGMRGWAISQIAWILYCVAHVPGLRPLLKPLFPEGSAPVSYQRS